MKRILCVVFVTLVSWCGASSAVTFCQNTTGTTLVVFGNGIMNSKVDANNSLKRLKSRLKATLPPAEFNNLSFDLAYNQSYGAMSDLYESLKQKMSTDNVVLSFWRWLEGSEVVPAIVRDEMTRINALFDFSTRVGTADLGNHITLYRSKILEGKKVVVVSHSQGNFFANSAYTILYGGATPIPASSFGIVSVANPASFVGGNGPYTTVSEDIVIAAIAVATPPGVLPPLAPNATNSGSGPEIAQVQINAGTIVRNYTVPLSTALSGAGDLNPTLVASIIVTGDATNGYQFSVTGAP